MTKTIKERLAQITPETRERAAKYDLVIDPTLEGGRSNSIEEFMDSYDREHPIASRIMKIKVWWHCRFSGTWLHRFYYGKYWGHYAPALIPRGTPAPLYIRFFVLKMRLRGHDPYLYTWDLGEHTFIFRTEAEAEAAFQCYKGKYTVNWGHLNHPRVTEELLKYCVAI